MHFHKENVRLWKVWSVMGFRYRNPLTSQSLEPHHHQQQVEIEVLVDGDSGSISWT